MSVRHCEQTKGEIYMTNRERMQKFLSGDRHVDRLPVIEWVTWWEPTLERWQQEEAGIPTGRVPLMEYLGLDNYRHYWPAIRSAGMPSPSHFGAPLFTTEKEFRQNLLPYLFDERLLEGLRQELLSVKAQHDCGDIFVWYTLEGFFWFPRTLFGIEPHLYAFYDEPDLMHEMNERLLAYHKKTLDVIYSVLTPEFMSFAEDMSYNHGPMISKACYDTFILPYYQQLTPLIRQHGTRVLVDSDGDVEPLIPWLKEGGIEGIMPLERQAGVDVARIRRNHPDWLMIGSYDKTIMHLGEEAMRREFERLLPTMKQAGFFPSVDHQTPPDVSLEQYRMYVRLAMEYARRALEE